MKKHGILESNRKIENTECIKRSSDRSTDINRKDIQKLLYEKPTQVPPESYKTTKKTVVISKSYNQNSSPKLCEEKKISETRSKQNINRQNEFGLYLKARWERLVNSKMTKEMDCRQKDSTATAMISKETIKENTALISQSLPLDIPQQPAISNLDINDYSTKPINIRLIDKLNEVAGEPDTTETNDDDDDNDENDIVTKWRVRRCVNHHRDMDELSTLEDSRTDSILQKYDSYKSNIRIASSKTRSISRQKHSEGLIFTIPRSVTKRKNLLLYSVMNNSTDTIESETSTILSTSDQSSSI